MADIPESVLDAVAEAIGDAYDCVRVWEAWFAGAMGPDDFLPVAEDGDRVAEIAGAAIGAASARIAELEVEVARLRACNDASLAAMRRAVLAMAHVAEDAPGLYGEAYDILDAAIDAAREEAG